MLVQQTQLYIRPVKYVKQFIFRLKLIVIKVTKWLFKACGLWRWTLCSSCLKEWAVKIVQQYNIISIRFEQSERLYTSRVIPDSSSQLFVDVFFVKPQLVQHTDQKPIFFFNEVLALVGTISYPQLVEGCSISGHLEFI